MQDKTKYTIIRNYERGRTIRELATATGYSYGAVWRVLHDSKIQIRPRGRKPQ